MSWIREKTRAEIQARLAAVPPRIAQVQRWLGTPGKPVTWTELRGKLTTLSLPSTNGGRLVLATGIVVLLLLLLLVVLPWYARPQPGEKGVATYPHAALLNPILTVGAAVAAGAFALMRHFQTIAADRQRRITESFGKAISQLASDKLEERLGGIYTLENISKESSNDYWTVMENLTAFVRGRTRRSERRIAECAYLLWEKAGRPDGRDKEFWDKAVAQETGGSQPAADITAVLAGDQTTQRGPPQA